MATGRLPDPNSSPLTAKGDLYTYSTVPAKLAVGNNGETLVADSSTSTGLRWESNFAAGKNKVINGDFNINQRSFSSTAYSGASFANYGFDRFQTSNNGDGTTTASSQTFTLGTAPVAGYEGKNFYRAVTSGFTNAASRSDLLQPIESVRTLAGQTATISFWAKAGSGTPQIGVEVQQNFGTGGSPSSGVNIAVGAITIGTTWQRYSISVAVPSIAGKTLGTNNNDAFNIRFWFCAGSDNATRASSIGIQNNTFDLWGVQVEAGNVATAFQTATGTLAGELAACQRYYFRSTPGSTYGSNTLLGYNDSTTVAVGYIVPPVPMRVKPTSIEFANQTVLPLSGSSQAVTAMAISNYAHSQLIELEATVASGLTAGAVTRIRNNNNTAGYIGLSAEL